MVYSNSYLYQSRHQIYYFRAIVSCRSMEGSRQYEYRRSLRTRDIETAKSRGRLLRIFVDHYQEGVKSGLMEWSEFKELLDQQLDNMLEIEKEHISSNGPYPTSAESVWRDNHIKNYKKAADLVSIERMGMQQEEAIPDYAYRVTDNFFKVQNQQKKHLDRQSPEYLMYCEAILQMQVEFYQQLTQLNEEARSFKATVVPQNSDSEINESVSKAMISEVVRKFVDEKVFEGSWDDKTRRENEASFNLLIKIINDGPISSVKYPAAQHFKSVLIQLPSNMNKKPEYRGKSIDEIRAMKIPKGKRLAPTTINHSIQQVSALFNWAVNQGYIQLNPFAGLKLKDKVAGKDKRLPFSLEDLQLIFSSKEYQTGKCKHPYYYWLPLMGLYTGARIEELCQLYLEDIKEVDGVWVFDMNESHDKKLKNEPSHRAFPVHSRLIELGFISYVAKLKKKGATRLFPELKRGRDGYSVAASRWFSRFWHRCPTDHSKKSFHSFRHTALYQWKKKKVPKEQFIAVSGHKDDSIATGWYGQGYEASDLVSVVETLDFPIDVPVYNDLSG